MGAFQAIKGGVTAPRGFKAAGVHAGIKANKPDLAVIVSDRPAVAAGTFTTNKVQAAPVRLCRQRIKAGDPVRAIVVNSGSANACTGPEGQADAERTTRIAAAQLGIDKKSVLVCSTGCIGIPLPMKKIEAGIAAAAAALSEKGGDDAAKAIMTTDTVDKQVAVQLKVDGKDVRIGGMAKGAGMIAPDMATMLAFLTTDAVVVPGALGACLSAAVKNSFNKITVDGDTSTNDTCLFLANGAAGNNQLDVDHPDWQQFEEAVRHVTRELSTKIVEDGEGATKFVTINVAGAASDADARKAARTVAESMLVKTSWFGGDPNWGRVMDALGYSGIEMKEEMVDITYNDLCAVRHGRAAAEMKREELEEVLAGKKFAINIDLHVGDGSDWVCTCDCSVEYVKINSDYTT